MVKARNQFDAPLEVGLDCGKSMTKQADKDACDINKILARYQDTGALPDMIREDARYGDFSDVPSYQEAFEVVARAHEQFEALDARARDRFQNDPVKMLEFCADPKNAREMVALGLAIEKSPSQPVPTDSGAAKSDSQDLGGSKGVPAK